MKKKIISLALLGATSSLFALGAEHAYLYKDARIMGMGGANVAVGSYSTSVFSNPAGLVNIKKDHGFVVDLLSVGISATADVQSVIEDMDGAETDSEMLDVVAKYDGQPFHLGVNNYTSISKNSDAFAWTIGLLAAVDTNFMTHSTSAEIETSSRAYGGLIFGSAKSYDTEYGKLDVGVSVKYIMQQAYDGAIDALDMVGDDFQNTIEDDVIESSGFGVDVGVVLHPFTDNYWKPAFGVSIMNIGNMDMDDSYGQQPMTVNFGVSVTPEVSLLNKLVIAVDYVDALNANEARFYNINGTHDDLSEADYMKRVRLGVGMGLIDTMFFSTTLNVGMYQSAYTAGVDMELTFLKLNITTYEEEVGTGSATNPDRRYMARLGIGW